MKPSMDFGILPEDFPCQHVQKSTQDLMFNNDRLSSSLECSSPEHNIAHLRGGQMLQGGHIFFADINAENKLTSMQKSDKQFATIAPRKTATIDLKSAKMEGSVINRELSRMLINYPAPSNLVTVSGKQPFSRATTTTQLVSLNEHSPATHLQQPRGNFIRRKKRAFQKKWIL